MTAPLAASVLRWARVNRVSGWTIALLFGVAFIYHAVDTRAHFDREDRQLRAVRTLLCLTVDKTRREVAEACTFYPPSVPLPFSLKMDSADIPSAVVLQALRGGDDDRPK